MTAPRTLWMFPRCKRRVIALDVSMMLRALMLTLNEDGTWDQEAQDEFATKLEGVAIKDGIKKKVDKKSGGPRTYLSQMKCLGLVTTADTTPQLTQAGEALFNMEDGAADALRWQVLRMQYPSEYSSARNVAIDPGIRIKLIQFLIALSYDDDIGGLTDNDIMVPVVLGKTADSFDECKRIILADRINGPGSFLVGNAHLVSTPKLGNKSHKELVEFVHDIANTFSNLLIGSGLCERRMVAGQNRLFLRDKYAPLYGEACDIPLVNFNPENPLQGALQLGLKRGNAKDTRRVRVPLQVRELDTRHERILDAFVVGATWPASQEMIYDFTRWAMTEFGVSQASVTNALAPVFANQEQYVESYLVDLSMAGPKRSLDFEKAITKIFAADFNLESRHTGQIKRQGVGGYADVLVIENGQGQAGIIDTKSTAEYSFSHDDYAKMANTYVRATPELYDGRDLELRFVSYISHAFTDGAFAKAAALSEQVGLPVKLCTIYELLEMRENLNLIGNPKNVMRHLANYAY